MVRPSCHIVTLFFRHKFYKLLHINLMWHQGLSQDFHNRVSKMGFQEDRVSKPPRWKKIGVESRILVPRKWWCHTQQQLMTRQFRLEDKAILQWEKIYTQGSTLSTVRSSETSGLDLRTSAFVQPLFRLYSGKISLVTPGQVIRVKWPALLTIHASDCLTTVVTY